MISKMRSKKTRELIKKKKVARVSVGCYVMWEGIFDSKDIKINQANFSVTLTGKQITTIKAVDSSVNRMGGD